MHDPLRRTCALGVAGCLQAWGVLEASAGNVSAARTAFQEGVWACGEAAAGARAGGGAGARRADALWLAWGQLEARAGDLTTARTCFARAVEAATIAGRGPAAAHLAWALAEERAGELARALELLEAAVRVAPDSVSAWAALQALVERVHGPDSDQARDVYRQRVIADLKAKSVRGKVSDDSADVSLADLDRNGNFSLR
jgi:tetratricopeptide (TPR) repeat protein